MTKHMTGTREEWLAARLALLKAEKELTRRSDELAQRRQDLPWVRVDKAYRFETDEGSASLTDLFRGRSQLLVYHFMFGPDYKAGCATCSTIADGFDGFAVHLANHDVMLSAVSRAPLAQLQAYKKRMGWSFPWASAHGGDFNFDFNVSFTEEQQREGRIEYNFERGGHAMDATTQIPQPVAVNAAMTGTDAATYTRERPGMSAFVREDGVVYHTYSTYARGLDGLWACTSGSIAPPRGATRRVSGGSATTSTTSARRDEHMRGPTNRRPIMRNQVVSHEDWLKARLELLAAEKEFTRQRDALTRRRMAMPWERVEKSYRFAGPKGALSLADLFDGRSQLVVYHFMLGPDWEEGCTSCSFWADSFNGIPIHLNHRDVTFTAVSRAPLAEIAAYKKRMGWSFLWVSSHGSDFNRDYNVSFTAEELQKPVFLNYKMRKLPADADEWPGVSVFYKDETGTLFHTYSCYLRGIDMVNGAYQFLDLVPKGRDEDGLDFTMEWVRRHDEYDKE